MAESSSGGGGISVFGVLGCIFVTLKLVEVIDWSWWWVLAPFYGPIVVLLAIALFGVLLVAAGEVMGSVSRWQTRREVRRRNQRADQL